LLDLEEITIYANSPDVTELSFSISEASNQLPRTTALVTRRTNLLQSYLISAHSTDNKVYINIVRRDVKLGYVYEMA